MKNYLLSENERNGMILLLDGMRSALLALPEAGDGGVVQPPKPPVELPVVYGRKSYTDANDPRDASARAHADENGRITGVHVQVHVLPVTSYRCTAVRVIAEGTEQAGQHIAKVTQVGGSASMGLYVGYGGEVRDLVLSSTHTPDQEIVISSKFFPPELGGLGIALVVGDRIVSDVVASIGLPNGHHVSYEITFTRR